MTIETMFADADKGLTEMARAHRITVRVEEELRSARADDVWYDQNPERQTVWPDLYAEHKAKLALLERLAAE